MIGGLAAVQIFMATSVLAILILVHYVVMRHIKPAGWRPVFLAAFICLLYGTIGIPVSYTHLTVPTMCAIKWRPGWKRQAVS